MGSADILLRPPDEGLIDQLQAWRAQIATQGAAVNQIARKLNEAKLRGRPLPFTPEDMTTIRSFAEAVVIFAEDFRILWETEQAAMARKVDKALAGLATEVPDL